MRDSALTRTHAHARQDESGAAAARRPAAPMSRRPSHAATVASALAGAFLAGEWEPAAMGRRGKRALNDRRKWLVELAHVARAGFPERPADRPRELAAFIGACDVF